MIINKNGQFFLHTEKTSYVISPLENGMLCNLYYGARISEDNLLDFSLSRSINGGVPTEIGKLPVSRETVPQEMSTFGRGDFRLAALCVSDENGCRVNELKYSSHKLYKGKPKIAGMPSFDTFVSDVDTLEIELADDAMGFKAVLYYSVFEKENIIARHTKIVNCSQNVLKVSRAASLCIDFPSAEFDMTTLKGSWAKERSIEKYPLHQGVSSIESRRGASSHQLNPFAAFSEKGASESFGVVYGISLVYSGDYKISAEADHMGNVRLIAGINPETFCWSLKPGEELETPEAVITYSDEGFTGMSANFHNVCRNHLGKCADKSVKHPIVINSWEAMYFDFDSEKIKKFISDCAGLGIDTVVIDDGWFGHRNWDDSSLGDWFVNKNKFHGGIKEISEFCGQNGMKLGIWFEPEMISRDSELYNNHPDWCISCPDRVPLESRQQLVLDMTRAEVVDYLYDSMSAVISENNISYVKWDMNRSITDNYSSALSENQGELSHRYILGVYSLMARLTEAFPEVFFEGCASGGGRNDFGILYYMPQIWTSDDADPIERLRIQYGTSLVYPPATMSAHVAACPNHVTGRSTSFKTRGEVAQLCNFGYEMNIACLSEEERGIIPKQTAKHRELEDLVLKGDYYRLISPFENRFCAWQLVSENKERAAVLVACVQGNANDKGFRLKVKGLDEEALYSVEQLNITASGKTLMNVGLPFVRSLKEHESVLLDIVRLP